MTGSDGMEATSLRSILDALGALRDDLLEAEHSNTARIDAVAAPRRESARNLVHYVAFRRHELRPLQEALARYGLSSLGHLESNVLARMEELITTVTALLESHERPPISHDLDRGRRLLRASRDLVLGTAHGPRSTRVMVTMPSEAADDPSLVARMGEAGMDLARINCAHDDEAAWERMADSVRALPGGVRIAMDLAGPKLRTGPIAPGPEVVKVRPRRGPDGRVVRPARILLVAVAPGATPSPETTFDGPEPDARIPVEVIDEHALASDAVLRLVDARGSRRKLRAIAASGSAVLVEARKTIYFERGAAIFAAGAPQTPALVVGSLPPIARHLLIRPGDRITLTRSLVPTPATDRSPHRIGCSLAQAFEDVRPGHRVLFDDGKLEGVAERVDHDSIDVRIRRAAPAGTKLRARKGINLPDTELHVPALTEADLAALPFVASHADAVDYSFVRSPDDVADLARHLRDLGAGGMPIILKIETRAAFSALPQMLLEGMRWAPIGVMIARGDLAVEVGFERLAEVQEEILWLCEAGHVPVVWATQVLDSLARTGLPSRAEVTDAAFGRRAECVMLNKGPYISEAIRTLTGILERMSGHVSKKHTLLRPLASFDLDVADEPPASPGPL